MAVQFALSWNRSEYWAELLNKRPGRAISRYFSSDYKSVEYVAAHINSINPEMGCRVEVFK